MDTTYFGRDFGVMVFKNTQGQHLYWKFVKYETIKDYLEGIEYIKSQGVKIKGIVCDGRKGLFKALKDYPVQMCQFHQAAIVSRYITRKPKVMASIELKEITRLLPQTDKESFYGALDQWYSKWETLVNERAINPETGKSRYVHKRLRSAYKSLERNKLYLFTWYDNIEMNIPNTNNILEGTFTALKNKLRNHNGLSRKRKEKFINGFLKASILKVS
jgi:aspartyl-tRNA synthetase